MKTLREVPVGSSAKVVKLHGEGGFGSFLEKALTNGGGGCIL